MGISRDTRNRMRIALGSGLARDEVLAGNAGDYVMGKTFYVLPAGAAQPTGTTFPKAGRGDVFTSLQAAIDECVADRGDLIIVGRGSHSVSTMVDINKRGITIAAANFGMPPGMSGETFTVNAASTLTSGPVATITDPCHIIGLGFAGRDLASSSLLIDCEESGGYSGGFIHLESCRFSCWYGAIDYGIKMIGGAGNFIDRCYFDGLFGGFDVGAIGCFNDVGGQACAHLRIEGCKFSSVGSGKAAIVHAAGSVPANVLYKSNTMDSGWGSLGVFLDNNNVASTGMACDNWLGGLANQGAAFTNMTNSTLKYADNHYEEA